MIRELLALAGLRNAAAPAAPGGDGYAFYRRPEIDRIYNLLFCDDLELLRGHDTAPAREPFRTLLSNDPSREALEEIARHPDSESRVRALAYGLLRARGASVPAKNLLGIIIEMPQPRGLDVLAAFEDGSIRYINHTGKLAVFQPAPAGLDKIAREWLNAAQRVVYRIGPWDRPRLPPPSRGMVRLTFLVSDGLYFGQGPVRLMRRDPLSAPVMLKSAELLLAVVDAALMRSSRVLMKQGPH